MKRFLLLLCLVSGCTPPPPLHDFRVGDEVSYKNQLGTVQAVHREMLSVSLEDGTQVDANYTNFSLAE